MNDYKQSLLFVKISHSTKKIPEKIKNAWEKIPGENNPESLG